MAKLRSNRMEYQQRQMARENQPEEGQQQQRQQEQQQLQQSQNNRKEKLMIQPISTVVENIHDYQSPCVQQQYPVEQNHEPNNNNKKRNNNDKVYNAFLIDASHVSSFDDNDDDDDDDDDVDNCRHSFYEYHCSTQGREEEKQETYSNKLFVTFDYGFCDSIEHHQPQLSDDEFKQNVYESDYRKKIDTIIENDTIVDEEYCNQTWTICNPHQATAEAAQFPVHRMQHNIKDSEMSFLSTLIEYDVDEENEDEESMEILHTYN